MECSADRARDRVNQEKMRRSVAVGVGAYLMEMQRWQTHTMLRPNQSVQLVLCVPRICKVYEGIS